MRGVVLSLLVACLLLTASPAGAWYADFFGKDASGAPTYEEMVIRPQAVHDPVIDQTYIVYQGYGMHSYVMAYDHSSAEWTGPYAIGENSLGTNTHGAPALVVDPDGHLLVFYGGHLGNLMHARSVRPRDISEWKALGPVAVGSPKSVIAATYPQPVMESDGTIALYYRRDGATAPTRGDWEVTRSTTVTAGSIVWGTPEMVVDGSVYQSSEPTTTGSYWYVNVDHDDVHGTAVAAIRRDFTPPHGTDFMVRRGVYYLERSAEGTWTAAGGVAVDEARDFAALDATAAVVPEEDGYFTNQVVLRRDASGTPAVLYLIGTHLDATYEWRFSRWDGQQWVHTTIGTTDNFFDSGTFEFLPDGTIEAFLTTGGVPDDQWLDDPRTIFDESAQATRGGDITWWRSVDGGESWTGLGAIIESPGPHARYNNPQIVAGYHGDARLILSEWNNDSANFIQKVFLWGEDGFVQRRFTPDFHRLAGATRIETAIEISKQGFPLGAKTAVIAAAHDFPDVLCGVPLAHALRAPLLLSYADKLDEALVEEIARLDVDTVIVLGGQRAVSSVVSGAIGELRNSRGLKLKVERISGKDRYETSAQIAWRLADHRGLPVKAVLASGEVFADALAVSPYAARRGYPVVLTPPAKTDASTMSYLTGAAVDELLVIGGERAIEATTVASYEDEMDIFPGERWYGSDRYETARVVAEHALDAGHTLERFSIATGENFADAVGGGLFAARYNTVLLTTRSDSLHPAVAELLDERAFAPGTGILDVYVLGGPVAISPGVENALSGHVLFLDKRSER